MPFGRQLSALVLGLTTDPGSKVRQHVDLPQHDAYPDVAVESLDLAVSHVEEIGRRDVDFRARWLDHTGGRLHRAAKGTLNRQLNGDDVAHDIDPEKFAVNVGKLLGHVENDVPWMLASI